MREQVRLIEGAVPGPTLADDGRADAHHERAGAAADGASGEWFE